MGNNNKALKIISIVLMLVIVLGFSALLLYNHLYNSRERVIDLADAERDGTTFAFNDLTIRIEPRGGDTGAWHVDPIEDNNGGLIFAEGVGTIYEMTVINSSSDTVSDWNAKIFIPEEMCVNNSWNGDFEFHQNVNSGSEKVQRLDLADYSQYDITLDHFQGAGGPMIWLHEGDYFLYYPDTRTGEVPLVSAGANADKRNDTQIGFIMYLQNRAVDYAADFSKGEFYYHLQTDIFKSPFFWVLSSLTFLWITCLLALIIARINLKRLIEQQKRDEAIIEQTMQTIVNFIEAKDPSTMGHSLRVAQYSRMLADSLGFSESECKRVYYIALMHDCGKIYIPDGILGKPARLTDEEFETMKKHTVYGGDILRDFSSIDGIGTGALCHHERYDGTGYPNGLAGEDIPLIARIICVSDAFDAMNSKRCYRNNLDADVILEELKNNKGKQFDPVIVDHLLKLISTGAVKFEHNK